MSSLLQQGSRVTRTRCSKTPSPPLRAHSSYACLFSSSLHAANVVVLRLLTRSELCSPAAFSLSLSTDFAFFFQLLFPSSLFLSQRSLLSALFSRSSSQFLESHAAGRVPVILLLLDALCYLLCRAVVVAAVPSVIPDSVLHRH